VGEQKSTPQEFIRYRRSAALPGIELLDAYHSPRDWQLVSPGYGYTVVTSWRGQAWYRGRTGEMTQGMVFLSYADEPIAAAPQPGTCGSFQSLIIAPEAVREWASESQPRALAPEWKALFAPTSAALIEKFQNFSEALFPEASDLELQSRAAEFAEAVVAELIAGASDPSVNRYPNTSPSRPGARD
jgi:hypothetical protein